jgi:hypothetical protein
LGYHPSEFDAREGVSFTNIYNYSMFLKLVSSLLNVPP